MNNAEGSSRLGSSEGTLSKKAACQRSKGMPEETVAEALKAGARREGHDKRSGGNTFH